MAARKRSLSMTEPISFSDLTTKLKRHADSFISEFDVSEPKMRRIVEEFQKIIDEVKKMHQRTDEDRREGAVAGGVGLGLMIFTAPLTGGASLLAAGGIGAAVTSAAVTAAGAAAVAAGGGAVIKANVTKKREEKESLCKVEELGKEFMEIVEPLKNDLEEIKTTCEELEQRSAGGQAKRSLSDMKEFQRILGRVSELRRRSEEVLVVAVAVMKKINDMLTLVVSILTVTATPEEDQKLRDSIIKSADQCQKVINAFDQMKKELLVIMKETKSSE